MQKAMWRQIARLFDMMFPEIFFLKRENSEAVQTMNPNTQQCEKQRIPKKHEQDPVVTRPSCMRSKSIGIKHAEFVVTLQRRHPRISNAL
jgi:hypothetical protein